MAEGPATKRWLPLEANPDVMNQFLWGLGLPAEEAECNDVYGLDEELLAMVPQPVLTVLFLYPLTTESEAERVKEDSVQKNVFSGGGLLEEEITASKITSVAGWHLSRMINTSHFLLIEDYLTIAME